MTKDEAAKLGAHLAGLMPTMSDSQKVAARDELMKLDDTPDLRNALSAYVRTNSRFVVSDFIKALPPVNIGAVLVDRTNAYRAAQQAEADKAKADWQLVDQTIAELTDEELRAEKAIALTMMSSAFAARKQHADPRIDLTLKAMIAKQIEDRSRAEIDQNAA